MYQDFSMIYFFATSSGALSEKKEPLKNQHSEKNQINGTPTPEVECNLPKTNMTMEQTF